MNAQSRGRQARVEGRPSLHLRKIVEGVVSKAADCSGVSQRDALGELIQPYYTASRLMMVFQSGAEL